MRKRILFGISAAVPLIVASGIGIFTPSTDVCAATARKAPTVSFAEDILPLLKWRCAGCHEPGGEGVERSGLDLTTYEGVMKGTKFGAMVIPKDAQSSNLMLLLDWRAAPALRMPHSKKQLSKCDRDSIRTWINEGALNN
jgi:cytochrome c